MKLLATSDLHGTLPKIEPCDLLIIAGDVCPYHNHDRNYQYSWLNGEFSDWLREIPAEKVIGIGGNHDFELQDHRTARNLPWTYLKDSSLEWNGIKFWGTPWVPNLPRWAFHASDEAMHAVYEGIPEDTDVVITHGPPLHCADLSSPKFGSMHCGHPAVNKMLARVEPKLTICGHIHESHGRHWYAGLPVVNVALLDDNYIVNYPIEDVTGYVFGDNR